LGHAGSAAGMGACGHARRGSARRVSWALWWAGVSLLLACPTAEQTQCCCPAGGDGTHPLPRGAARALLRLRGGHSQTAATCYYELLGLRKGETPGEHHIRHAYHKKALRCHPDRAPPEKKEQAERAFKALKEAYDVLMDPMQRRAYDWGGAGFSAEYMPSANFEDMPSAFDNLAAWEKYFGVPFSDESSEDDKEGGDGREIKALKEALDQVYLMPSARPDDMPSIFDSISVWEKYLGLPVSPAGAHRQPPVKPDADASSEGTSEGTSEGMSGDSTSEPGMSVDNISSERNVHGALIASMNDKAVEREAACSGVISEWENYLTGFSPSCSATQVL
jgi:curved DNA-binding protein CbpA